MPEHAPVGRENTSLRFNEGVCMPVAGIVAKAFVPEVRERVVRERGWQCRGVGGSRRVSGVAIRFLGPNGSGHNEVLFVRGEKSVMTS